MRQKKKTWSTRWNGHTIVVENWFDWRMRNGENVFVDGDLLCEHRSEWNTSSTILDAEIHDENGAHQLRVQVGSAEGVGINCLIFVDDELVGGDTEKKLILPAEPETQLTVPEQKKQLKRELFFRAVVAPLILIPLCDIMDLYFLNSSFSILIVACSIMLVNVAETLFKLCKVSLQDADTPKNSTPV